MPRLGFQQRLDDASPLVRAAAVWAFSRLAPVELFAAEQARRLAAETEPLVAEEWRRDFAPGGTEEPMAAAAR